MGNRIIVRQKGASGLRVDVVGHRSSVVGNGHVGTGAPRPSGRAKLKGALVVIKLEYCVVLKLVVPDLVSTLVFAIDRENYF
jgi:hypothetical protein